ncbi:MAG: hypothetical protein ACO3EH_00355 [Ilumatobacteraceae bacterium]
MKNAENALKKALLANRCPVVLTEAQVQAIAAKIGLEPQLVKNPADHEAWCKLYYGQQRAKADRHLANLAKDFPAQAAILAPLVADWIKELAQADVARAEKKAALQARRDARAEKAAKRAALGVNLRAKGGEVATEDTYLALRAGLKSVEEQLRAWLIETFTDEINAIAESLKCNGGRADISFPKYETNWKTRNKELVVGAYSSPHPLFGRCFSIKHLGHAAAGVIATAKPGIPAIIKAEATTRAADALAGFCAKLAGKVDRDANGGTVTSASCNTSNIWGNSLLIVETTTGKQVWQTKVIWNRSVLGKQFNQWPTRRVE